MTASPSRFQGSLAFIGAWVTETSFGSDTTNKGNQIRAVIPAGRPGHSLHYDIQPTPRKQVQPPPSEVSRCVEQWISTRLNSETRSGCYSNCVPALHLYLQCRSDQTVARLNGLTSLKVSTQGRMPLAWCRCVQRIEAAIKYNQLLAPAAPEQLWDVTDPLQRSGGSVKAGQSAIH